MNGWDPGGKECPTIRTLKQIGGSISSFIASSNLDFLIDPNRVFAFDIDEFLLILASFYSY